MPYRNDDIEMTAKSLMEHHVVCFIGEHALKADALQWCSTAFEHLFTFEADNIVVVRVNDT